MTSKSKTAAPSAASVAEPTQKADLSADLADASLVDTATEPLGVPIAAPTAAPTVAPTAALEPVGVAMVRLVALGTVHADGVEHAPGAVFSVRLADAQALLACGAAEPHTVADPAPEPNP